MTRSQQSYVHGPLQVTHPETMYGTGFTLHLVAGNLLSALVITTDSEAPPISSFPPSFHKVEDWNTHAESPHIFWNLLTNRNSQT